MNFNIKELIIFCGLAIFLFSCGNTQEPPAQPAKSATQATTAAKPSNKLTKEQKLEKAVENNSALKAAIAAAIQKDPMVLFNKYNLNDAQKATISKSIEANDISKISGEKNVRNNPKFKAFEKEVRAVLNPNQIKKFDELLKKMK